MQFIAEPEPSDARARDVADLAPDNAFATAAFATARRRLGHRCWLLGLGVRTGLRSACFGFIRHGRLNRSLELASLPTLEDDKPFWDGLLRFCHEQRVTILELNSFSSRAASIPTLPREAARRARMEWVIDLTADWQSEISTNHRRNISRSRKLGVSIRRGRDADAQAAHCELIRASIGRRQRRLGEDTTSVVAPEALVRALTEAGAGDCFQAVLADRVLSSTLILKAELGGYYHSAATSDEGMEAGASAFLIQALAETLRLEGRTMFNLGDAGPDNPGLQRFKAGFGARGVPLTAVRARPFSIRRSPLAAVMYFGQQFLGGLR
jgi:hypothetical protein